MFKTGKISKIVMSHLGFGISPKYEDVLRVCPQQSCPPVLRGMQGRDPVRMWVQLQHDRGKHIIDQFFGAAPEDIEQSYYIVDFILLKEVPPAPQINEVQMWPLTRLDADDAIDIPETRDVQVCPGSSD